jgi:Bifunctional DNA primase/polymerase, N-terminal/AAA domain
VAIQALPHVGMPMMDWALWYALHLGAVFPCRGKDPMFKSPHGKRTKCRGECGQLGHGVYDATRDEATIRTWWTEHPGANIGLALPAGLVGVDLDERADGPLAMQRLEAENTPLPRTLTNLTGSGHGSKHLLFTIPPGIQVRGKLAKVIDIKHVGGYLIVPPSIHPDSGQRYMWEDDYGPDDLDPQPMPSWLLEKIRRKTAAPGETPDAVPDDDEFNPSAWLAHPEPIYENDRNTTVFLIAEYVHRQGKHSAHELYGYVHGINAVYCKGPMEEEEVDTIIASAERYEVNPQLAVRRLGSGVGAPVPLPYEPASNDTDTQKAAWGPYDRPQHVIEFEARAAEEATAEASKPPPGFHNLIDLADLIEQTFPVPQWLIRDLIPEGLVFFAGSPKSSKTYLAYSLALSLAMDALGQQPWLGHYPILNIGPVVYITLEDDPGDSWQRIKELMPDLATVARGQFIFHHGYDLPPLGNDFIELLTKQVLDVYNPVMVVLDPISYLYPATRKGTDQFSEVKELLLPLRWLAKERRFTLLAIDHRRKKSAEDVDIFETTYGSNAKPAIADSMLMVIREGTEVTIHARVRKAQEQTMTLGFSFDDSGKARWEWKGAVDGLLVQGNLGELRFKLLKTLADFQEPMTAGDLIAALNLPESKTLRHNIDSILSRCVVMKEVARPSRGKYLWAGGSGDARKMEVN